MLNNLQISRFHILIIIFSFSNSYCCAATAKDVKNKTSAENHYLFPIGVVLDLNSPFGSMVDLCMNMALSDFYLAHPNYTTRLLLHTKNAETPLDASFAVVELLNHEKVHGIIGPDQGSPEETFFAEIGQAVHVPIISFTTRSSALSYVENSYFFSITTNDAAQAQALAAICQGFEWPEVVVLYEDTDNGNRFLSHLNKAFQEVEIGLAYMSPIQKSAENDLLIKELDKIRTKKTKVFFVHMNPSLGYRLFNLAKEVGVISEGYVWIITDSISNSMNSMDFVTRGSMEGVLGIRPYVPRSKDLESSQDRWKRNMIMKNTTAPIVNLNVYGLRAYDAVTALAIAVEKIVPVNYTVLDVSRTTNHVTCKTNLSISTFGKRLLNELSDTKFKGLSGDFQLVDGRLKTSTFEIFNVIGTGEKIIGFWTQDKGIMREVSSIGETTYSTSTKELKNVLWPGDSVARPKGWAISTTGKLRVSVPGKQGFPEFVNVTFDPATNHIISATGFSVDIFMATLKVLPFPMDYEFYVHDFTIGNWSYDDFLEKTSLEFDIIVADITIWAPRLSYVDFSLPYSDSNVGLVVKNQKPFDMWIFTKPLRWELWLAIFVACILMGAVLHILESRVTNSTTRESIRPHTERLGMIWWSPITVLAFQERNMVSNKWSVFVLVCWLFMAFILMQSFTDNLSAILTVDHLKFAFSDNYYVGFQHGSFMKKFLTEELHISGTRLRGYSSLEDYHNAMSLGSQNGGIDAIFDEIPYLKLFMNKYQPQYKMVGPTYRTSGLGFAFPIGSPLVAYFSRAILNVTQSPDMNFFERKNFGPGYSSQDPLSSVISQGTSSLSLQEFAGLFLIIGSYTLFALFYSETSMGRKLTCIIGHFIQNGFSSKSPQVHEDTTQDDGDESHEVTQDTAPGEGGDAQIIGEGEEIETGMNNEVSTARDDG